MRQNSQGQGKDLLKPIEEEKKIDMWGWGLEGEAVGYMRVRIVYRNIPSLGNCDNLFLCHCTDGKMNSSMSLCCGKC